MPGLTAWVLTVPAALRWNALSDNVPLNESQRRTDQATVPRKGTKKCPRRANIVYATRFGVRRSKLIVGSPSRLDNHSTRHPLCAIIATRLNMSHVRSRARVHIKGAKRVLRTCAQRMLRDIVARPVRGSKLQPLRVHLRAHQASI